MKEQGGLRGKSTYMYRLRQVVEKAIEKKKMVICSIP